MLGRTQNRLVSTWGFIVLYYASTSPVGPRGVTAQNITTNSSSSTSSYLGCSGYVPFIGDAVCDEQNNNAECDYDGGDCCSCTCVDSPTKSCGYDADFNCTDPNVPDDCGETPSPAAAFGFPNCTGYIWDLGDEICDDDLNNEECGFDGGDCCRCTCRSTGYYDSCGYYGYDCLDPDAPTDCESESPTPSPAAALGYPDCTGDMSDLQNGYCDWDLNNEECGYDGGDCCRCTCEDGIYYTCGYYGYDCEDPTAPTDCPTPSPTPTPAAGLGYPDCTGDMSDLQNGNCDSDLNNEECGYDGGDCCSCTCEDGIYYTCGYYGYDCEDPTAPTDCPTPSPTPTPAAGLGYPDCTGDMSDLQNGYCDSDLNNEECGYDGGDCCSCTCEDGIYYTCGYYGYDCEDPTAPTDCPTPSPTPTPAASLGYPDCTGDMTDLQNGYCDSDLNNEDCGYDGGDCCECPCTDTNDDYDCGYNCRDPDPCSTELDYDEGEKSSEGTIPTGAVIFIACLCAVCLGGCIIMIRRSRRVSTAHSVPLSPPPAYWTTTGAQQRLSNRSANIPAGQQETVAQPVGPTGPSHYVYVVNPRSAAAQSGRQPRVVMPWGTPTPPGQPRAVTGLRAYLRPSAPPTPPQPDSTVQRTHGVTTARVTTFRSAPVLGGTVLEESANTAAAGYNANVHDVAVINAERIRLAVAESRRVQTISEALVRQEMCLPQPDASTTVVTRSGRSPSGITNGGNVEEKDPSNADEKDNDQEASSESEWDSDGEGAAEKKGGGKDDELGAEGHHQPGTGEGGDDDDRREEIIGSTERDGVSSPHITNGGNVEEKDPSDGGKNDNDQGSENEKARGEDNGTEDDDELRARGDRITGTGDLGGDIGSKDTGLEGEKNDKNTPHGDVQAASSNIEEKEEISSGDTHQDDLSAVLTANISRECGGNPSSLKEDGVDLNLNKPTEGKDPEDVAVANMIETGVSGKENTIEGTQEERIDES